MHTTTQRGTEAQSVQMQHIAAAAAASRLAYDNTIYLFISTDFLLKDPKEDIFRGFMREGQGRRI